MSFITPNIDDKGILKPVQNNLRIPNNDDAHTKKTFLVVTFLLILINLPRCFSGNFWLDETCTIYISKMPVDWIINDGITLDMHPPLYYLLIAGIVNVFGSSPFVYHFTTLAIFMILLLVCATAVFAQFGKMAALIMMGLATFLTSGIYYIIEARMYELGLVFTFCAFVSFYYILNYNRKIDWFIFVASSLIASYSYYYCLLAVGLLYLVLLVNAIAKRNNERNDVKRTIVAIIVSIVGYLPCLIPIISTFNRGVTDFWIKEIHPLLMIEYLFNIVGVVLVPLLIYLVYKTLKKNYETNPNKNGFLETIKSAKTDSIWIIGGLVSVFGTILIIVIVSVVFRPLCVPNHLYPISAIAWLLLAVLVSRVNFLSIKKYVPAILAVTIIAMCASYGYTVIDEKLKSDSTQNILDKTTDIESGDIIITDVEDLRYGDRGVLPYYYPGSTPYYTADLMMPTFKDGKHYWLFISNEITKKTIDDLELQGYKASFRANGSFAERYYVNAYQIVKM